MSPDSNMCATVEIIKYKPGKLQVAADLTHELQAELQAVPGRKQMISTWNDDGLEYVLSIWESPAAKAAAASELEALGSKYGDIFEEFESLDFENVWYVVG